jgi:hypothetical protein
MSENHDIDLPLHWAVERYEKTGHGKLIARFRYARTGWELNVLPYKNYELPGFSNCHRITLTKDDSIEVVAEGLEVEHADEAEAVVIETMQEISDSR